VLLLSTSSQLANNSKAGVGVGLLRPVRADHLRAKMIQALRSADGTSAAPHGPAGYPLPAPFAQPAYSGPAFQDRRVLLAEDNPINQKVARALLGKLGCQVELASNGRDAVALAGNGAFDLILMDCQMPVMDGFEATREIRALGGAAGHVPIVALTASAMTGDREHCLASGMNDYLTKPVDLDQLRSCLGRWLPCPISM
jgi:two-component system, sensor histidine kinase and response regulator